MDDKIKTILKANHLYDKDNKKLEDFNITHNKLDEFYDTYKQNHTNKQSIPEVKRDKEGRIILEEIPFIVSNTKELYINWLLLNNGTKLLIKENRLKEKIKIAFLVFFIILYGLGMCFMEYRMFEPPLNSIMTIIGFIGIIIMLIKFKK